MTNRWIERLLRWGVMACAGLGAFQAGDLLAAPPAERQRELVAMVRQDCGSCHGMTLKGGLGPALLPATLGAKTDAGLVATILGGRPGTAMPAWSPFLSEPEAVWVVEQLKSGFPTLHVDAR